MSDLDPQQLADRIAALEAKADSADPDDAGIREFDKAYYQAILDTSKASIDRSRSAAQLIATAAAAIGTIYTGILGVSFAVANKPVLLRAALTPCFLGLAIALSMFYLAYLTAPGRVPALEPNTTRPERMRRQAFHYTAMVAELVNRRSYALRASVVALGVAVLLLPAPFVDSTAAPPASNGGSTTTTTVDWPAAPPVSSEAEATVAAIKYQAEVNEAVEARKASTGAAKQESFPPWALLLLILGLIAVFGAPLIDRPSVQTDPDAVA